MQALGKLQTKATVYCSICGQSHKRTVSMQIHSTKIEDINLAKSILAKRIQKTYTCRICTSIVKDMHA